jgi:hypothetical protein
MEDKNILLRLLNNKTKVEAKDLADLLSLLKKYPDFKLLSILLLKFPSDIFNIDFWNNAEHEKNHLNELYRSYFPLKTEIIAASISSNAHLGNNKEEIKERQTYLIKKFIKNLYH